LLRGENDAVSDNQEENNQIMINLTTTTISNQYPHLVLGPASQMQRTIVAIHKAHINVALTVRMFVTFQIGLQ
jgi:hypothetical protein